MATYKPINDILSGKLAGRVYLSGPFGLVVRQWRKPTVSTTARAIATKNAFITASTGWLAAIALGAKPGWEAYAVNTPVKSKSGSEIFLTDRMWFIANNAFLLNANATPQSVAPATPGVAKAWDYEIVGSAGVDITVANASITLNSGDTVQFQVSAPFTLARGKLNAPTITTIFTTGDAANGTVLVPAASVIEDQVYFVLGTILDSDGKLQRAPIEKRIAVAA